QGASVDVMSPIFNAISADVIALNATRDPARYSRSVDDFEQDMQILASITGTLKTDLGVRIDTGGERIYVLDDRGRRLDGGKLLAALAELTLRRRDGGTIAVPVTAPSVVETVAEKLHGKVVYTKVMPYALTSAATSAGMVLVGDGAGGFVFPEFQPVF